MSTHRVEGVINIMLACAGGMSSSMLVKRIHDAATEKGIDVNVWAISVAQAAKTWEAEADILLIGPQVRFEARKLEEDIQGKIPFAVMDMRDYGTMNGVAILETALNLLGK